MKIAINTNLEGLSDVAQKLSEIGTLIYPVNYDRQDCLNINKSSDVIFTNPNNLGFRYDREFISKCSNLRYLITASTGTDHIDVSCLKDFGVQLIFLRHEQEFMRKVTATAEHAMCLTLASARNLIRATENVRSGNWSWDGCVGTQISSKTIGVIGYGRLGKLYASYMQPMAKNVLIYDPLLTPEQFDPFKSSTLCDVLAADIISIHIHADQSNLNWLDEHKLSRVKSDVIIVNTSRGGIVNESHLASFLNENCEARYATDVLANELDNYSKSPLFTPNLSDQILITPHIGGMTRDSRALAYGRAVKLFEEALKNE